MTQPLNTPQMQPCTCHPDDKPPVPCARKYALTECRIADAFLRGRIAGLREAADLLTDRPNEARVLRAKARMIETP